MRRLVTDRQAEVLDLAGTLADVFAERAGEHDRDNTFPAENWPVMAEAGTSRSPCPAELGGFDADPYEFLLAQERLAQGDGATALAVNMHLTTCDSFAALWRRTGDERAERFLRARRRARGRLRVVHVRGRLRRRARGLRDDARRRSDGGFRLNGRKIFFTESDVATHFTTCARLEHPALGPHMVFFNGIPIDAPGLAIVRTWDTLGMRATQSNDLKLEDVFVPGEALFHAYPVGHLDAVIGAPVMSLNVPSFGAVSLGIAAAGMELARRPVVERGRSGSAGGAARVRRDGGAARVGARGALPPRARGGGVRPRRRSSPVMDLYARGNLAKYVACENAIAIMDRVMEVSGGVGYHRRFPIERLYRDVRAGAIMPYSSPDARTLFAQAALGIEPSPVHDYAASAAGLERLLAGLRCA